MSTVFENINKDMGGKSDEQDSDNGKTHYISLMSGLNDCSLIVHFCMIGCLIFWNQHIDACINLN